MPKLTSEEKEQIILLREKGLSSRQIANEIFGDKASRKSTINDFLKSTGTAYKAPENKVKILFLDIETAPAAGFYFGNRYEINISQDQVISESFILTYSAKYLGNENVIYGALDYDEVKAEDDYRIVAELYDLLNEADIVVAHNGKAFDIKVINARLVYNKFNPPLPYKVVDTLLLARRAFKFPSNKLDALCKYLGIGGKISIAGFATWKGYLNGDPKSMEEMVEYNNNDVLILEELYLTLRAWDNQHPNLNVYAGGKDVCPCCGGESFALVRKFSYTNVSEFTTYHCNECGKIFKNRRNNLTRELRVNMTNIT